MNPEKVGDIITRLRETEMTKDSERVFQGVIRKLYNPTLHSLPDSEQLSIEAEPQEQPRRTEPLGREEPLVLGICKYCNQQVLIGFTEYGKRVFLNTELTQGKWTYRVKGDFVSKWAGSGPGYARHVCERQEHD